MKARRLSRSLLVLLLTTLAVMPMVTWASPAHTGTRPIPGMWTVTGSMTTPRVSYTATLLANGKVLVAGGYTDSIGDIASSAELYDPGTGAWTATGSMTTPRVFHTATLLPDGKVLIAGGIGPCCVGYLSSAEVYDPATGTFSPAGSMSFGRAYAAAALLPNGTVLVVGGGGEVGGTGTDFASAEVYNPSTGIWSLTGSMNTAREMHVGMLPVLSTGQVLIAGGSNGSGNLASAELYDPNAGTWMPTRNMRAARDLNTETLLQTGNVLVAGGDPVGNTAESYTPSTGTWTAAGNLTTARYWHTATLLPNGQVLVAGGLNASGPLASAELYDPITGHWTATGGMSTPRYSHTATLLPNGQVLVAGGDAANSTPLASAELYTPPIATLEPASSVGVSGQTIAVTGTNYGPSEQVRLYWDSTRATPLVTPTSTISGTISATFTVPQAVSGTHTLIAIGQTSGLSARASFVVKPVLQLSPSSGPAGSTATVTGFGFGAWEVVVLLWDRPAQFIGATVSNAQGTVSMPITIPTSATGLHRIYARGLTSHAFTIGLFNVN